MPILTTIPEPEVINAGDKVRVKCHLEQAGNPPARIGWFKDMASISESRESSSGDIEANDADRKHTSSIIDFVISDTETEILCKASNGVTSELLKRKIRLNPIPLPSTTSTTSTTSTYLPTTSTPHLSAVRASDASHYNSPLIREEIQLVENNAVDDEEFQIASDIHDIPVADMPSSKSSSMLHNDYDYSHFEYLNEDFDKTYKDTLKYASQYQDYYDDYEEYQEPSPSEKEENSNLIKKLKEQFSPPSSSDQISLSKLLLLSPVFIITKCFHSL